MNLVLQDGIFMAGLGALGSYVKTKDDAHDNEWTDIYWQFILGIDYPVTPRMNIAANAYYPFYRWSDLDEFKFEDLDFGIRLSFKF
jgi:opacity protein-like surface antigen